MIDQSQMTLIFFSSLDWLIIFLIVTAGIASYTTKKLTLPAAFTGIIVAILIFFGSGMIALSMLASFFILGIVVTAYQKQYKLKLHLVEQHESQRTTGQVFANGGIAAVLALLSLFVEGYKPIFELMIAGSLAAATSDTFSSELGNVHGRNFYNILNFKKDQRGLNGVISIEGTVFGILGSGIIGFVYVLASGWSRTFFVIVIAGLIGNLFDSVMGALFERKGRMGNNAVNLISTSIGALVSLLLWQVF